MKPSRPASKPSGSFFNSASATARSFSACSRFAFSRRSIELTPEHEDEKPKRVSLPKDKDPSDVDMAFAVKMLELPRTIGEDPETGDEVVAGLGRFGPFVRRGKVFASLKDFEMMWTVSLEDAVELVKLKESGKRQALKELGKHPESGAELVVLSGRYGPYVTDGSIRVQTPAARVAIETTASVKPRLMCWVRSWMMTGSEASPSAPSREPWNALWLHSDTR